MDLCDIHGSRNTWNRSDNDVHDNRWIPGSHHDTEYDRPYRTGRSGSRTAERVLQHSGKILSGRC